MWWKTNEHRFRRLARLVKNVLCVAAGSYISALREAVQLRRLHLIVTSANFYDFYHNNYLNICQTDLHEICSDGRTSAADKRNEVIVFRSPTGRCRGNQFLSVLWASIHRIGFASDSLDGGEKCKCCAGHGRTS